jgi:phage-related minor tail protein
MYKQKIEKLEKDLGQIALSEYEVKQLFAT